MGGLMEIGELIMCVCTNYILSAVGRIILESVAVVYGRGDLAD